MDYQKYRGDAEFEVWRRGGDIDRIDPDRLREEYQDRVDPDHAAERELRRQRTTRDQ